MTTHVHQPLYFSLKGKSISVCLGCQKMLSGPEMSEEDEKKLIESVRHLTEGHAKKDAQRKV